MKQRMAAIRVIGGRNYRVQFHVSGYPVQVDFERIPDFPKRVEQLQAAGAPMELIHQVNPMEHVFYCHFKIADRNVYHATNHLDEMLTRLQRCLEYYANLAVG